VAKASRGRERRTWGAGSPQCAFKFLAAAYLPFLYTLSPLRIFFSILSFEEEFAVMEHHNDPGFEMKHTGASASISEDVKSSTDDLPSALEIAEGTQSTSQDHKDMQRLGKQQEFRVCDVMIRYYTSC